MTKVLDGVHFETFSLESGPVQTYKVTLPAQPAGITAAVDPQVHDGHEWLYVLSGRLRLVLGEQEVTLGPGEAAEFDTRLPHWMSATSTGPVEMLSIYSKEGKRIHLRARPTTRSRNGRP